MPLSMPEPPESSRISLLKGLNQIATRPNAVSFGANVGGAPPQIANPHQVFSLGLADITANKGLDASARPVGWRYQVQRAAGKLGGAAFSSADVLEHNGQFSLAQLNQGWIADATQKAVQFAQGLPQVQAGSFELRTLRLPALLLDSLWLKNRGKGTDLIIPIASKDPQIQPLSVLSVLDFLDYVRKRAQQKLGFNDRPLQNQR